MHNQKVNIYEKFKLLNSQEHTDEIYWSSSSCSDYENRANDGSCNLTTRSVRRKRKKKTHRNISNLNVTLVDLSKDVKYVPDSEIPIINNKGDNPVSPVLIRSQRVRLQKSSSPILPSKSIPKSPVIIMKSASPISTVKIRRKLFDIKETYREEIIVRNDPMEFVNRSEEKITQPIEDCSTEKKNTGLDTHHSDNRNTENKDDFIYSLQNMSSVHRNTKEAKLNLARKVKTFFDNHFSSESASQNSISDGPTPKESSKTSEELEILSCKTQIISNNNSLISIKQEDNSSLTYSSENSLYNFDKKSKKVRYKKDGLAYRLNALLKKRNAILSLWQHERFLAENSNFIIPKGEHTVFRIQKVSFKYGCYLLETKDKADEVFMILINNNYISEHVIETGAILKLYEPYNIVLINKCKLINNVTKFECISFKQ